jgi:hypothetical protein
MLYSDFINLDLIPGDSQITVGDLVQLLGDLSSLSVTIALGDGGKATVSLEITDSCDADGIPYYQVTKISSEV